MQRLLLYSYFFVCLVLFCARVRAFSRARVRDDGTVVT